MMVKVQLDVPKELHGKLKAKAALEHKTLRAMILEILEKEVKG
jgi:predicted HicB family RNase H-like nuclease